MFNDIKVLLTEQQLKQRVQELGNNITSDYKDKELILVCVLKGGYIFAADLARHIDLPLEIDFISISSYGNSSKTSGVVKIVKDLETSLENKNVLIVEDIVDTGLTLSYLKRLFLSRNPESVKICSILSKPSRRVVDIDIEYKGFDIADKFVVGYGLDYAGKYRNLPFLGVIDVE